MTLYEPDSSNAPANTSRGFCTPLEEWIASTARLSVRSRVRPRSEVPPAFVIVQPHPSSGCGGVPEYTNDDTTASGKPVSLTWLVTVAFGSTLSCISEIWQPANPRYVTPS